MSVSRKYFILEVWFFFSCFISFQNVSGIHIELTRRQAGDYFGNPYDDDKFCFLTNSNCLKNAPKKGDRCRSCLCNLKNTTFDLTKLCCIPNDESLDRRQCSLRFDSIKGETLGKTTLLDFDLTKPGDEKIKNLAVSLGPQYKLQKCVINKVLQMSSNGYEIVSNHTFDVIWKKTFHLTWSATPSKDHSIHGRVFKITFRCEYRGPGQRNKVVDDCIMLKSQGTVQIEHPGLPEPGTTSSSVHQEFIKPSSTFYANLASSTKWTTTPLLSSVEQEKVETSTIKMTSSTVGNRGNPEETVAPSSSSIDTELPTGPEKEKRRSEKDGDAVVYVVIAVVIVVLVIVLIVAARLMMKRKKKKMMRKRESQANIVMSDMNKNNINQDDDETYTALDATKIGKDELNYEALTLPGARKSRSIADAYNEKMRRNENEYVYADADRVYSTIEAQIDDDKLGAKNNAAFDANENERVYSILEQKPGQIDYATRSIRDDSERVYSVLETEPGQIAYGTSSNPGHKPADQGCTVDAGPVYSTLDEERDVNMSLDYVTVLPPKVEPAQSDRSIYTDLSEQRAAENQYQSLVKRKK